MKNMRWAAKTITFFFSFFIGWGMLLGVCLAEEFAVPGLIEAWANVTMKSKASGTLGSIAVEEGDLVKEGAILLELENNREKAMIRLSAARVEKSKASLSEAMVALQSSSKDLERKEIMKEVIPKKDLENAQDLVRQHEAIVRVREGEIKEAEAELHLRTVELENTLLRAPFDGMVSKIHVKAGETVAALNTNLCDVAHLDKLFVQVAVPIPYLPSLHKGMKVSLRVEKDTLLFDKKVTAEIWYIYPIVDPSSRRFQVKILLRHPNPLVRAGMIAEVFFPIAAKKGGGKSDAR
jgi:membrane fusion protein (multidrug efflux system)